jgi:hypothetical protein
VVVVIKNAGFIDQTSTKYQNPVNNNKKENKVGLMNQAPTEY